MVRECRTFSLPLKVTSKAKKFESDYYIEGYATTFNDPYILCEYEGIKFYEVIDRNALDLADLTDVIMQYDHSGKVLARQSNNTLGIEPNNNGLFIFADLSKSLAAKEVYEEIRNGLITKMSWAFIVEEDSYNNETKTRTISKVKKIYDVSAVSIPANDGTNISARNFVDERVNFEIQNLINRRKRVLQLKLQLMEG